MYNDKLNKEKYFEIASKMVGNEKWIYVEGATNKAFYQNFSEINHIPISSGGSCGLIIDKVRQSKNAFGIIDNDYRVDTQYDRIFNIDYYSIENIELIFHPILAGLKDELCIKFHQDFRIAIFKCLDLVVNRDENRRVSSFNIIYSIEEDSQYKGYLSSRLLSNAEFVRYKRLKNVVVKYIDFLKQINGRRTMPSSILLDTFNHLPTKTIADIFEKNTITRIKDQLKKS